MGDPHKRGGGGGEERCGCGGDRSASESIVRNSHLSDDSVSVSDHDYHHHPGHDNKSRGNPSYADHYNRQQERRRHHHSFNSEPNDSTAAAWVDSNFTCHSLSPCSSSSGGRKRPFSQSSNSLLQLHGTSAPDHYGNGCRIVKLYVAGVPKTATREDIGSVFEEHGSIVEIVLIRDKRTGQQGECCFVKYATIEEADGAIQALHDRYTFPGGVAPLTVRYADGQKERCGSFGQQLLKLYVGCVNRQSTDTEIEEIFSPFGVVEDVFIVRDEMRQHRGCAFVQFSRREMAVAAINALHGNYIMRGCNQPLIVRFADPKKPRPGGPRNASYLDDRVAIQNDFHPSMYNNKCKPELVCGGNASESMLNSSPSSSSIGASTGTELTNSVECEWSEHMCPDGYPYYYNCVTSESRWEKPEEYAVYEGQLLKLEEQQQEHQRNLSGVV